MRLQVLSGKHEKLARLRGVPLGPLRIRVQAYARLKAPQVTEALRAPDTIKNRERFSGFTPLSTFLGDSLFNDALQNRPFPNPKPEAKTAKD